METPFSHEDVARLMPRLERIARDLAFEPDSADDLVQEAWLETLRARPSVLRRPLGWMQVVMRRRWSQRRTRDRLRQECEQLAAQVEARSDDEAELASTAALVVIELSQLDSPYREVLRMRFLEERSIREIADHTGSSPETVRSQVHRGLARLRERLDRRAGSRDLWAGLLLNAARIDFEPVSSRAVGPGPTSRLSVVSTRAAMALVVVVSAATAVWIRSWPTSEAAAAPPAERAETIGSRSTALAEPVPSESPREPASAMPLEAPEPEITAAPDVPADATRLVLLVEDADGRPVPDARAEVRGFGGRFLHDGPVGADGRLVLDIGVDELIDEFSIGGAITVAAWSDELTRPDILGVKMKPGHERTLRVPLEHPSISLHGRVIDPEGEPIPGATVECQAAAVERRQLEPGVIRSRKLVSTLTDENGEYRLTGVVPERLLVLATKPGFVMLTTQLTPQEGAAEDITLQRGGIVAGFVSYADGRAASGARVWVGTPAARERFLPEAHADEDGFFLMGGLPDGEWEVFACDPRAPSLFAWSRVVAREGEEVPFEAVLQPTTGVRVRVLDREGAPFAGAGVVLTTMEPSGPLRGPAAGSFWSVLAPTDASGRVQVLHVPDVPLDVRVYPTELRGNGDRSAFRSGVLAGGPELTVQVGSLVGETEDRSGRVRGTLLQPNGEPLAGALVHALPTDTAPPPLSPAGGPLLNDTGIGISEVKSDGSFVVDDLSPGGHQLIALSLLPQCAGVLDLGHYTVLSAETLELGTRSAPEGQLVRFERETPGEILLTAVVGPYWQPWLQRAGDSLELRILAGSYWVGTHGTGAYFDVPGESVITVPE